MAAVLAAACASQETKKPRVENYVDRTLVRVQAALEEKHFLLRHNPAAECGCPPFEVKLDARWQRVEIGGDEDDEAIVALVQAAEGAPAEGRDRRVFEVEARLEESVALCGRGGLYVSLVPTAFLGVVEAASSP